ncbi:MAG: UbiD family decarboxylase [Candidatus Thalassarchaeaceae archaeon]|nr:UbiD family decarboxylase [Candidatus Thalassarchaeaceae archaeon]
MAFRDHLGGAYNPTNAVSCLHGLFDLSTEMKHLMIVSDIIETPGHKAALNVLSRQQLCNVFNVEPGELIDILGWAMENPQNPHYSDIGPVLEQTFECVDLNKIPIPHHYREDRGRYMSASIVIAEYNGIRNVSFHRQFVRDENHVVARLVPRHLRTMVNQARENGETIPIVIANGCDPVVLLAAAMSFENHIDELTVASALHERFYGQPLPLVTLSNGIPAPANAEYVMTAEITLEDDLEGPYVDITGTVDDERREPVIKIHEIHHRTNPIYHALIPAQAEHKALMGLPRAPTIKSAVSAVTNCHDVYLSDGGCGWLSAVVSITPNSSDDGRKAINAALNGHKSMKSVTIVNQDIDVSDPVRVEWALMTRWQPDKDTVILSGQKGSSLDPSRNKDGTTSKIGYDATLNPNIDPGPYTSVQ